MDSIKDLKISRKNQLLEQLVIVDGQAGSGKSMFTSILPTFKRIELYNYSTELENLCALNHLAKIDYEACKTMIKIQLDQMIYETMMSRRVNFRYTDVSSAFNSSNLFEYIRRAFSKGDQVIPDLIKNKKPILNLLTHNLLSMSKPLFEALNDKLTLIEIIRHPLYMIIQQTFNHKNFYENKNKIRQFHVCFENDKIEFFPWNYGYEDEFLRANPVERAILEMHNLNIMTENFKKNNKEINKKIIVIPFEDFVMDPSDYIKKIEIKLDTKSSNKTIKTLIKHKVPRKKLADSLPLKVYERCGWKAPVKGLSEKQELILRRDFVMNNSVSKKYINLLDRMSEEYEAKYFSNVKLN